MKILKEILVLAIFFCNHAFSLSAAVFYGSHVPVTQLCKYELLIVDPSSDFDPNKDCINTSKVFAYASLGEVSLNSPYLKLIQPNWIIGKNKAWNKNKILDQTKAGWQTFFLAQIIEPLWQKGYRGFFLDTLDSFYLAAPDPKLQEEQIKSIVSTIHQIKIRHPEAKIILNRGFVLLPYIHADIYAVLIESLYHAWHQKERSYAETTPAERKLLFAEINKIRAMNLPIIIVDYLPPSQKNKAKELATQLSNQGFIPWITDSTLQAIYCRKDPEIQRQILIAYDHELIPQYLDDPLNLISPIIENMGYIAKFLNLDKQLPQGDLRKQYAGIILHLSAPVKNESFMSWVQRQIKNKIPVVFLHSFGVPSTDAELSKLGLFVTSERESGIPLQIVKMDPEFIGHENQPTTTPYDFIPLSAAASQVLLKLKNEYQQTSDVVAITPWGGYALRPYALEFMPKDAFAKWTINPFPFFHKALRLQDFPIPDTTTENGRRLMSVHIDGDGFFFPARWIGGTIAAQELHDRILKRFPIPTSVSVITGEIAPNGSQPKKSAKLMKIARDIFALPWVEIASHTFSHPFNWQQDNKIFDKFAEKGLGYGVKIPNYTLNLATEITGSVDFINKHLAPADKKCNLFFWSGLANPSAEAIALTYKNNLLNINGGNDTHIDYNHPSLTGIMPKGYELGGNYQVFAPIDLDYYFMNDLTGPLYGYEKVIQTLELTDKPHRYKPIDLYFHFYGATYPASLQALIKVYNWALEQQVMNIFISDYIKKVLDFYQISISKSNGSWLIATNGDIRELRSPPYLGYPDLLNSQNVIGFRRINDELYIHLGPSPFTRLKYQKTKPPQPYLVEANARIVDYSRNSKSFSIEFAGYMSLQFTFANVSQCKMSSKFPLKITHNSDNTITYSSSETSNEIHFAC
jgi:polysaccharide biosynthesis protein PelA